MEHKTFKNHFSFFVANLKFCISNFLLKKDVSFWNAVSDSKSTPTVRKYLSQDFLSEMTTSTDAEIEQMERIVF